MLLCLTANHQNASFDLLEKLSIGAPAAASTLVSGSAFVSGAVVLATCNRFEAYLDIDEPLTGATAVAVQSTIDAMSTASGVQPDELRRSVTVITGDAVAGHLFSVTAGLESVVVGEDEISGQVGRALEAARTAGTASSTLDTLFQTATRTSREVKNHTALGGAGRSLVRLALELASSRVTDWSQARVLLVGTGQYAATTLAALRDRGASDVRVFSPSGRAARFAAKYDIPYEVSLASAIAGSDVVVTCTSTMAITPADVTNDARRLVIDLGLPRNVDPGVASLPGVELLDLDLISRHAPVEALSAATDARALIGDAAASFTSAASVEPSIVALRSHIFDLLDAEIGRAERRAGSPEAAADTVSALRHLAGVLLHGPSVRARDLAREGRGDEFVAALDALYGVAPAAVVRPVTDARDDELAS